jgi:hypothetical protein
VQALPQNAQGLPPVSEADIVSVEYAITERLVRMRAERLRHVGGGLVEARTKGQSEEGGQEITILQYFDVVHIKRLYVQSALNL